MSSEQMIWVAYWEHHPTADMYAATTRDTLYAVLAAKCLKHWPEGLLKPPGDWLRVRYYFDWHAKNGDETLTVEQVVLEHDLADAAE